MTGPYRYFAILGAMRTGSNLLEKTLEYLGDTVCYGEAFNPSFISGPRKQQVLGYTVERRDADPIGFLERLIAAEPSRIAGLRVFVGHNEEVTDFILRDPRCFRIILKRDPIDSYISLKIARKTDQWMLRNPKRRTTTRIRFVEKDFLKYRNRLQAHYDWLEAGLARYGTDAVRIDYADLEDPAVLQNLASKLGSTGNVPSRPPILRQNPSSRAQKVENLAEMCEALNLPMPSPEEDALSATPVLWPQGFAAGYAPIYGNAFEPMVALLHRLEVRDFGRDRIAGAELYDMAARHVLYAGDPPDTVSIISMVSDPFRRLHAAFVREVFGPGAQFSAVRRSLEERDGPLPPPRRLANGKAEYSAQRHQQHFVGFLELVGDALSPTADLSPPPEWMAQADLLRPYQQQMELRKVFRHETFADAAHWMTGQMNLPAFPPGQINGMRQAGRLDLLPIEQVITPQLTGKVMDLYQADYQQFGYTRLE